MDMDLYVDITSFIHKHLSRKTSKKFPQSRHRTPTAPSDDFFLTSEGDTTDVREAPSTVTFASSSQSHIQRNSSKHCINLSAHDVAFSHGYTGEKLR